MNDRGRETWEVNLAVEISKVFVVGVVDANNRTRGRLDVDFTGVVGCRLITLDRRHLGRRVERIETHRGHGSRDAPANGRRREVMHTLTGTQLIDVSRCCRHRLNHTRQMIADAITVLFDSQTIIASTQQWVAAQFTHNPRRCWRRWRRSADVINQLVAAERPH